MASRRNIPPPYDERFIQASEMIHRGPLPPALHPMEQLPPPVLLENKLVSQEAEIDQLARDNHKLASTHLALRQDLEATQREAEKLREHIRSIQTEADIQIRILLEKNPKLEAEIRAGNSVKKELQEAHTEARRLVTARQELTAKLQQATKELEKYRSDVKKIPELHAELDSLRQEHKRLRKTFEYEKGLNIEKVEQMKLVEKDLIGMAEEVERLRAEVLNAEKRASAPIPYTGPYMNTDNLYPPPVHGPGGYAGSFGGPHLHTVAGAAVEGMNPYAVGRFAVGAPVIAGPAVGTGTVAAVNPSWGVMYNMPHTQT